LRNLLILSLILIVAASCKKKVKPIEIPLTSLVEPIEIPNIEYGFNLNDFSVVKDTVRDGDSFGQILFNNNVSYAKISEVAQKIKDTFDVRRINTNKTYTLLKSEDSLQKAEVFIYQNGKIDYVVVDLRDSINAYTSQLPVTYVEREVTGKIAPESNISLALEEQGISPVLAYDLSDIYAWTIDFNRLMPGDKFKVIYTERYIDDSTYAGIDNIKAAYFEHNKEPLYAFEFETDTIKGLKDYFSEDAKNLRRAFLKAPVEYRRISSRYNLRRRIALYGNRIRPHKGTDFAAKVGTPIRATANGTVIESKRRGGNGNYVKIKHNATYSTQYLHMQRRLAKVGDFVKQGDVIGTVGMTGNTSGPHVCYRFWKNGKQVDPFKQKLPEAEPISDSLKAKYLEFIAPIKTQLDSIQFKADTLKEELADDNKIT